MQTYIQHIRKASYAQAPNTPVLCSSHGPPSAGNRVQRIHTTQVQSRHIHKNCVCVTWRPRGHWRRQRLLGDSRESCAFAADGRSCTRTRTYAEPAIQLPIGNGCCLCRGSDPNTIKTSKSFASLDLHSSAPPYHHTPWGPSSWQSDRPTLTVSSGYGGRSTRRASTACSTAMAPSCRSP